MKPFYFGCEADDRSNAWAFNTKANPFGARLNADIGHFDVPDMMDLIRPRDLEARAASGAESGRSTRRGSASSQR